MADGESSPGVRVVPGGRRRPASATRRRGQIIQKTLLGLGVSDIAREVGLSERQTRRILMEPDTRDEIKRLDDEVIRVAARRAAALGSGAILTLGQIMTAKSEPAAARVSAAKAVLDVMLRVSEIASISERLEQLEASLSTGGTPPWRPRAI